MSKYSVEEVRALANDAIAGLPYRIHQALLAFAERIEADESAVACGYLITWRDPLYRGKQTLSFDRCHADNGTFVPVFTHPPAHAAQADVVANLQAQVEALHALIDGKVQRESQVDRLLAAEPVAQGEVAYSGPVYAMDECGLVGLIQACKVASNPEQGATAASMCSLLAQCVNRLAAQPRAVPDGWMLVPVMPTPKMLGAMRSTSINRHSDMYQAALAAAPSPGEPS